MSMHEALRAIPEKAREWFRLLDPGHVAVDVPPTPAQDAEILVALTRHAGTVDRTTGTWNAHAQFAATEIIAAHAQLETARGDSVIELQARIRALRDLLSCDQQRQDVPKFEDQAPHIP